VGEHLPRSLEFKPQYCQKKKKKKKKNLLEPGVVVHVHNPSTPEAQAGGFGV
jgi:hypothetical protein